MNKQSKIALYCRTAHEDADAITAQANRLIRFAAEHGFKNFVCYLDNGENGATLDRPAMNRLIADIKGGEVDSVIVCELSRIARNIIEVDRWSNLLVDYGVSWFTLGEGNVNATFLSEILEFFETISA